MKKLFLATTALAFSAGLAMAEDVKIGLSLGFTGPLESMSPNMANGAELAIKEANDSGKFLDGSTITAVRADNTCADAAAAVAAVERLVTSEGQDNTIHPMATPYAQIFICAIACMLLLNLFECCPEA